MTAVIKKRLKAALLLPWHTAVLATPAKSFRDNPVIGNRVLNALGLHVIRLVLAHAVFGLKLRLLAPLARRDERETYRRDGFILKRDFLPKQAFEALRQEARDYSGEAWQCVQGNTITWRALIDEDMLARSPATRALVDNRLFARLLKYTSGRNERPLLYIQQIQNGHANSQAPDPQKVLHADTFHPTMKAWLFLEDVGPDNGPFTYVRGSNRLSFKRICWEYRRSLRARYVHDGYSEKGSFRIQDDELAELGLPLPESLAVPANTLVIANTCGFHRRGDTQQPQATRLEIWAMSRTNPFNPFPGLGIGALVRWRDRIYRAYLRRTDRQARARGRRASWHAAPGQPK
ncbi:phytanoyl-CoA dioxygenase family protein [Corticibacter populi]|uniref:phytanoyl-CoA dioxygenase family protein n=1 Tax=Corticibacter populi TaxID=1550736 RepID=UPI0010E68520|nr:phytanoyl-CoA dioxygenase family protein [Corticibacter populi]RZS33450.1 phytanoyl-CoA dioxygenase PhyH [Corticibacter populi]